MTSPFATLSSSTGRTQLHPSGHTATFKHLPLTAPEAKGPGGTPPTCVARFDARRRAALRRDAGIVRNRLKIDSTVSNARAFLAVQREFGSFDRYLWAFVARRPIVNRPRGGNLPARTALSDRISRDLKKRGFRFVGSTIVYAFLQAVGLVNDHARECFRCPPVRRAGGLSRARPARPK